MLFRSVSPPCRVIIFQKLPYPRVRVRAVSVSVQHRFSFKKLQWDFRFIWIYLVYVGDCSVFNLSELPGFMLILANQVFLSIPWRFSRFCFKK